MILLSVKYLPSGKKRLRLKCEVCQKIVIRCGFGAVKSKSCGCVQYKKHGDAAIRHPLYQKWHGAKNRCLNKSNSAFKLYGGRGITICDEWMDYVAFREWALKSGWSKGLFLDRIDNNKGYNPDNCRWVTVKESNRNRRWCIGESKAIAIRLLVKHGMPIREISHILKVKLHNVRNVISGKCWSD